MDKEKKILVVGDSCTDVFIYGDVKRLAPEGPAPVFLPLYQKENGGMAANVSRNISSMGFKYHLITQREKIIKTRFVDERTNYTIMRLDENDKASRIQSDTIKSIKLNYFDNQYYEAIIISDYCKGFLNENDIELISKNNKNIFLDTKKILGAWCKYVDYIKINNTEYDRTKHTVHDLNIENKLIITRSEKGCEFNNKIYPVKKVNIKDLSGAGDTFIAGLTCEWLKSNDIVKAIDYAQNCAATVVEKRGVCTI